MATWNLSLRLLLWLAFAVPAVVTGKELPGTWELLLENAGISAMHTAVTRFNTVILLDRTDNGPSQIKLPNGNCRDDPNDHALRHDCYAHSVLLDLQTNEVRPLTILTDTWCSSGQFLPNGTLLQTGGYNDGKRKIRKFDPCEPNALCDWVEMEDVELTAERWYATNQILPDGSMIIVGGIYRQTLEYYPPRLGGAVDFPFLYQVRDNQNDNLYPFVHLLPTGNLFIFANTKAILYDYDSNVVVKELPELKGVPRNYPSGGSSVMLALQGDYSAATIVICGGAQKGAYKKKNINAPADKSCGWIIPTQSDPFWTMEIMPFPRNMGDMVLLPTGDVLIINGAQAGSQGYGLATTPCLYPVLYRPSKKSAYKFKTLKPSAIPRMYHSTANLLPDGRILIAGSNTHYTYVYDSPTSKNPGNFPTEVRIEAFSPDYLSAGNTTRPVLLETPETVSYGETFDVLVSFPVPVVGRVIVNLMSAPFTTHSYSQGQRSVRLAVTKPLPDGSGGYKIGCTAPPNGKVAPPGWYMAFVVDQGVPSVARWVQLII